jgi:uncharacterized membrane protein
MIAALILVSCDSIQPVDDNSLPDAAKLEFNLPVVEGSDNFRLTLHRGTASFYDVEIDGLRTVSYHQAPYRNAWAVFPDKFVSQPGARFNNITLLNTRDDAHWQAVNYLLNIRRDLASQDERITSAEIQAAIWVLSPHAEFDLSSSSDIDRLPSALKKNGAPAFDVSVVHEIVQNVEANYRAFKHGPLSVHAVLARAGAGQYGFIMETGTYRVDVTDLKKTADLSVAWSINNRGQIAGGNLFHDPDNGTMNMGNVFARALNDQGMVVGNRGNNIVIWQQGNSTIEVNVPHGSQIEAHDINNNGQIVGELVRRHLVFEDDEYGNYYDYEYKGFVWDFNHNVRQINENGWASSINDNGEVVGLDYGIQNRAYKWDEQRGIRGLGSYNGFSSGRPNGVNNDGHVVGSILVNQSQVAAKASGSDRAEISSADQLQRLTGTRGIFDHAHVAEMLRTATYSHEQEVMGLLGADVNKDKQEDAGSLAWSVGSRSEAFLWSENEGITRIGTLGGDWSTAWDVNDRGQAVGYSSLQPGVSRAYIWDRDHGMIELPGLGGNSLARSVNNRGEAVGYSYNEDGRFVPVKWTVTWIGL